MNCIKKYCVCFVTNDAFFDSMLTALNDIRHYGYTGDICVVIGDDLKDSTKLNNYLLSDVIVKHFSDIKFSDSFIFNFYNLERDEKWRKKIFQYHKFYLFNTFFKQWDYIFYLDSNLSVFKSIEPILNAAKPNKFLAHSDAYPLYKWTLKTQFVPNNVMFDELIKKYNLDIDYPQTTIMLFDTDIIKENTFTDIINLAEEFSISRTNDQGITALYFTNINNCWEQIQLEDNETWFYAYCPGPNSFHKPYILLKEVPPGYGEHVKRVSIHKGINK